MNCARARAVLKRLVPPQVVRYVQSGRRSSCPVPVGSVQFGSLRRVEPISHVFGYDRPGKRVGRYYIEQFLSRHASDVRGRVLEIGDNEYTRAYGGSKVSRSDVLHATEGNPNATLVADLTCGDNIPSNAFDCIILTQTLQFIYDVRAAIHTLERILKPGGVLLTSSHGISQISRYDMDRWGDYWRFTTLSMRRLLAEVFPEECISVEACGNVLTALASLHGVLADELSLAELEYRDPDYELLVLARVVKPRCGRNE